MKNCWTCKYLQLLELEYVKGCLNFTHGATKVCPFLPDNLKCWDWGGRNDGILLDTRNWDAWVDACGSTENCEGYVEDV